MPVLPLEASTTVCPGVMWPWASAHSSTPKANRSFTLPPGFWDSSLAKRFTPFGMPYSDLIRSESRTMGVLPMVESTFSCTMRPGAVVTLPSREEEEAALELMKRREVVTR